MKILHVMASCSINSGVASVVMNYYRKLHDEVVFDFLMYWDVPDSYKNEILQYGGDCFFTGKPSFRHLHSYIKLLDDYFKCHKGQYDAIQLHELYMGSIIFRMAKKYDIKILIAHSHSTEMSDHKIAKIRNKILFYPVRFMATHFFACSRDAGIAAFGSNVVERKAFYVIKNAIDAKAFKYDDEDRVTIRKSLDIGEDEFVIGHVGRFCIQKNHEFLLRVFIRMLSINQNLRLLLVGDGEERSKIEKLIVDSGIKDKVIITGSRKDIGALLSAMDIFLFPSLFEGLGIALIEAQVNGLPCLASSAVPVEAAILPNYNTLSLSSDVELWAKSAIQLIDKRIYDTVSDVDNSGYLISSASKHLISLYRAFIG